ncbi:MAG: glycosyltransferase [Bacteroides sp.]|nr:glycosyltransferase [Bacteroides sp.]
MAKVIHNVGNMVIIPPDESIAWHSYENNIIFVGKMSYEPNIVAVNYFAKKIFPHIRRLHPTIKFYIIGANPDSRVLRLSEIDGIEVTGYVETLEPYFQTSTIVVAPMLTGAGIQNKIIQAMSYGCCVATSSIGAEGLTIEDGEIAIYNSEEEWISGLILLLSDSNLRRRMGNNARKYVMNHLSKDVIESQFRIFIDSVNVK